MKISGKINLNKPQWSSILKKGILCQELTLLIYIFMILSHKKLDWNFFCVFWKQESKFSGITETSLVSVLPQTTISLSHVEPFILGFADVITTHLSLEPNNVHVLNSLVDAWGGRKCSPRSQAGPRGLLPCSVPPSNTVTSTSHTLV